MRNLTINKENRTVWGSYCYGAHASFDKKVTSWEVIDTDTQKVVYGGVVSGGNTRSGYAKVSRKKDAKAYIDGYNAFFAGLPQPTDNANSEYGWYIAEFETQNRS